VWFCSQNNGLASLLARLEGMLGPLPQWMKSQGRYTNRYYTKAGYLYRFDRQTVMVSFLPNAVRMPLL
jgi:hypothetical protein